MSNETAEMNSGAAVEARTFEGFTAMTEAEMRGCIKKMGLSMDEADLALCVEYFRDTEKRDPTMDEIRLIDTYRSEACRHTVFNTVIDSVTFEDTELEKAYRDYLGVRKELGKDMPVTLSDIADIAGRYLKRQGRLEKLGAAGAGGARSVMINVETDGENEPWLLISDKAFAYAEMKLTGTDEPSAPVGRDPSEYSNRTGICAGMVDEIYHPAFAAKRMEAAAVMAAVPSVDALRGGPEPGDLVMVIGEPKAPCTKVFADDYTAYERKIHRLFCSSVAGRMIKKHAAFGPAGALAAMGRIAAGVDIDTDALESAGGSMACIIDEENENIFSLLVSDENLSCVRAAVVTEEPRIVVRRDGSKVIDISREFTDSGCADRHTDIMAKLPGEWIRTGLYGRERSFTAGMHLVASDVNTCSRRGLTERYDHTIGRGTVLLPFGGSNQITPAQAMVQKIPLRRGETDDCTMMAWGCNPFITAASPYHGAYLAVIESISKLIASGASFRDVFISLRENFEQPGNDAVKWGKPLAATLGVFEAQLGLGIGVTSVDESMNEGIRGVAIPPSLVSFAVTTGKAGNAVSPEFKEAGHKVVLLKPYVDEDGSEVGRGLPLAASQIRVWEKAAELLAFGEAFAAYAPGIGGVAEAIMKMSYGNGIGFSFEAMDLEDIFGYSYGCMVLEVGEDFELVSRHSDIELLGHTTEERSITFGAESVSLGELMELYEGRLEGVFPAVAGSMTGLVSDSEYKARSWQTTVYKRAEPKVLIPVFPGTVCEEDSARVLREAGAVPELIVIKNNSEEELRRYTEVFASALKETQMLFLTGGSSGSIFENESVREGITELLDKNGGLICGLGRGFGTLVKLGLLPDGTLGEAAEDGPALELNSIGSYRSKIVRVRIASNRSPWLRYCNVGDIYSVPVSCSTGRFTASDEVLRRLSGTGQIATQFVDGDGKASADIRFNPGGSMMAIEGITSLDGRIIGRIGRPDRVAGGLYRNVPGEYLTHMFEGAVRYFK